MGHVMGGVGHLMGRDGRSEARVGQMGGGGVCDGKGWGMQWSPTP